MPRLLIGSILGGLAMWLVGFVFWGTPLALLAYGSVAEAPSAELQAMLAQNLPATGTYWIPNPNSSMGTELMGRGPNAMIHFVDAGLAQADAGALLGGLILSIVCALGIGIALRMACARDTFGRRLTVVLLFAVAVTAYSHLGQPIFNHMPWGYFVYLWISEVLSWAAAGAVLAWILPHPRSAMQSSEEPLADA